MELGYSMSKPPQGRVVIVTGAADGIGRAGAVTLAEAGAQLVVTDIVDCDEVERAAADPAFSAESLGVLRLGSSW
jgi:NAD(P)-dependent dehydrogenase (short-subunit alcohol dehydrogenase family)